MGLLTSSLTFKDDGRMTTRPIFASFSSALAFLFDVAWCRKAHSLHVLCMHPEGGGGYSNFKNLKKNVFLRRGR